MADYDINLQYHPGKITTVPDALRRKTIKLFLTRQKEQLEKIRQVKLEIVLPIIEIQVMGLQLRPPLMERVKEAQKDDPKLQKFRKHVAWKEDRLYTHVDKSLLFSDRLSIPKGRIDRKCFQRLIIQFISCIKV